MNAIELRELEKILQNQETLILAELGLGLSASIERVRVLQGRLSMLREIPGMIEDAKEAAKQENR